MNDTDRQILDFEKQWWQLAGNKESEIQDRFGMSAMRYYQRLTRILDDPEALATDPTLVRRLRRIRDSRMAARRTTPPVMSPKL